MTKVFISYARPDEEGAVKLYKQLKKINGVDPWLDKYSLLPGMRWKPAIRKAIRESNYFLALLSDQTNSKRGYRNAEIKEALEVLNEFPQDQIFLIPVRLNNCEMPRDEFSEITWVDMFPKWEEGIDKLLPVICGSVAEDSDKPEENVGDFYRVAVSDLDMGVGDLRSIIKSLNEIQNFFYFTYSELPSVDHAVTSIGGMRQLATYQIPDSFYSQRTMLNVDYVACLTKYPLAFKEDGKLLYNYFSGESDVDEKVFFVSADHLSQYCQKAERTLEEGIVYLLVGQLAGYFSDLDFHPKIRSCVMDFCEKRSDQILGLTERKFCKKCLKGLKDLKDKKFKSAIKAMLSWTNA